MATDSSILAWEIQWIEKPGRLQGVTKESDMTQQLNNPLKLAQNTYISLQLDKVIQRKAYFINEVLNISEDTEYCTESEEQND